jgi:hypothetical protein
MAFGQTLVDFSAGIAPPCPAVGLRSLACSGLRWLVDACVKTSAMSRERIGRKGKLGPPRRFLFGYLFGVLPV